MQWSDQLPEPAPTPSPHLVGARSSGKTTCLIASVMACQDPCLAIIAWPWQRQMWKKTLGQKKNVAVHTPESLAREIIANWERKADRCLVWENGETPRGTDAEEHTKNQLTEGIMTAGSAHWLLKEELTPLLGLEQPVPLLALDDQEDWEPEAREWIKKIPHERKIQTVRKPGPTWLPGNKPQKMRTVEVEYSTEGAGQWTISHLEGNETLVVIQTEKEKWNAYLRARGVSAEVRHASETEGRQWATGIIPSLKKQWGSPTLAKEWLNLAASRCQIRCIIRIGPEGPPRWLPDNPDQKKFLSWEAH